MNEYEERGRSIKAFRIARVLVRLIEYFPDPAALADPELTTPEFRRRVAALAGVRPPSDATWAVALDWLDQFTRRP